MNSKQMGSISFKESYPPPLRIPGEQAQSGVTAAQQLTKPRATSTLHSPGAPHRGEREKITGSCLLNPPPVSCRQFTEPQACEVIYGLLLGAFPQHQGTVDN